jgi:flavodoxin/NAD-dependent dihydropyrimidine dehydrogenase PreA subunit
MKAIIVYFSQTGNTKQIAQAIQKGMKPKMETCDMVKLKELDTKDLAKYDLIGLGSPVWRLGAPNNIVAFLNKLPSLKGKLGFVFCTHGALPIGFMKRVVPLLQSKGMTVIGFNDWYGGCFLPYLPNPYLTDGHPDEIDLKEARAWGREIAQRAQRIAAGETGLIQKIPREEDDTLWHFEPPVTNTIRDIRGETQRKMRINMEKCRYPSCTICIDNCPMDAIDFSVSPPVIKKFCHADFFCQAICPEGAIEANFTELAAAHDLVVRDRFIRTLNEETAKGKFRWLTPLEKIGWKTHQHETTKHPRLKPA